ncbi:MAG: glycoside hydrolase family 2 protein, partial [Oscillospiraceae bacterium]
YIEFLDVAQIDDFKITQEHKDGTVLINVNVKPEIFDASNIECEVSVEAPNGKKLTQKGFSSEFLIKNPELWWTNDLSDKKEQPLYKVTATLYKDGKKVDTNEKKIGLRTIVLNRDNDVYGSNFQFILNGVPLFIKGANYIPPDSFITRFDEEKLQYTINSVLFSNMNMLRIWGGGYYESDELYDACDK